MIVLSDLFDDVDAMMTGLKHLRHRRHEVILMHVLDPAEVDFPFEQTTLFRGLEQLPDVLVEPRALRKAYLAEFGTLPAPAASRLPAAADRLRAHADRSVVGGGVVELFGVEALIHGGNRSASYKRVEHWTAGRTAARIVDMALSCFDLTEIANRDRIYDQRSRNPARFVQRRIGGACRGHLGAFPSKPARSTH